MTAKEILGLAIRMFGLFVIALGCENMLWAVIEAIGLMPTARQPPMLHCIWGISYVFAAFVIIKYADTIAEILYSKDNTKDK
jgi:hypothetical protein